MNATSAACCDDDDEDDEEGEAADMEGAFKDPSSILNSNKTHPACPLMLFSMSFRIWRKWPVGNRRGKQQCYYFIWCCEFNFYLTLLPSCSHFRQHWTPVKWLKLNPKQSLAVKTPSFKLEHMTCTSLMINTTRPLDSGSLDMMKYVPRKVKAMWLLLPHVAHEIKTNRF